MNERAGGDPLVSIGMPVRNGGKYIRQALDSLLAQSYERFELIVSDNASTDDTQQTCLEYASRDNRITYHRNSENLGIVRNFSRVFELSSGTYFFWAAHDDLWDQTFIARCVEVLSRSPSAVLCYPKAEFIGPAGEPIEYAFPSFDTSGTATRGMDLASRLHVHMWGITYPFHKKGLIRSQALAQTRLKRDTLNFDLHLLTELSVLGEFAHIPAPLFYNRLTRQGDFLDQLATVGDYVDKPVTTTWSAVYYCAQLVYGNVEAVNRHTPRVRDKVILIPSVVFCTMVKQRLLMQGLLDLGKRSRSRRSKEQGRLAAEERTKSPAVKNAGLSTLGGADTELQRAWIALEKLEEEPAARPPSRFGRPGNLARRLALRGMRPFTAHQRKLDAAVIASIGEVRDRLGEVQERLQGGQNGVDGRFEALDAKLSQVVDGIELGSVPARETTYLGRPFVYPYDSSIGRLIDDGLEWDAVLRTLVSELLTKEEPVIWEVGSNIGASLYQILEAKPRARVVAFEPSRRFRPFLDRNLELAGFDDVDVLPLFLGRELGRSTWLYDSGTTAGLVQDTSSVLGNPPGFEPHGREAVQITTLDEVMRDREPVDFIKVDVDGFELEVLRGAAATLERDRPIIFFELTPGLAELASLPVVEDLAWLRSLGYGWLLCLDPAGKLVGGTDDPAQAISWAEANLYCDVVTWFQDSVPNARVAGIESALRGS